MLSYNTLLLNKRDEFEKFSRRACYQNDGISCLNLWYLRLWPNFFQLINMDQETIREGDITLEKLKEKREQTISVEGTHGTRSTTSGGLNEEVFINQKYIEELDNQFFAINFRTKTNGDTKTDADH
ncbi:MAG: hypothetical protein HQK53_18715 [Oligoflexia bacterium]|nr:hypothetical protein [Oligoflexia bacterium]